MSKNVVFKSTDGKSNSLTLSIEEAMVAVAKAMLAQGMSMVNVRVDDLHDASVSLKWLPKETLGKDPKDHRGDDDCG
jgi:hypothetical protein